MWNVPTLDADQSLSVGTCAGVWAQVDVTGGERALDCSPEDHSVPLRLRAQVVDCEQPTLSQSVSPPPAREYESARGS